MALSFLRVIFLWLLRLFLCFHLLLLGFLLVRPIMEFPVQFARVEILQELFHLSWNSYVLIFGEEVHVSERVDSNEGKIILRLAKVAQWVGELEAVGDEEVDVGLLRHQLSLDQLRVFLHTSLVIRLVKEDEEGKPLLSQFLGVFKRDFSHDRGTVLLRPAVELVVVRKSSCESQVWLRCFGLRSLENCFVLASSEVLECGVQAN